MGDGITRYKIDPIPQKQKPTTYEMGTLTNRLKSFKSIKSTYRELSEYISKGHAVLLADFKEDNNIDKSNIYCLSCIALDIDSKVKPIARVVLIEKIYNKFGALPIISYNTFSDTNNTKFRLIYRLDNVIDLETYETLYKALQWKLKAYLDQATFNANRIWQGTNKYCEFNENDIPFTFNIIAKLITSYTNKIKREELKQQKELKLKYSSSESNYNGSYIKTEHKKEVMDQICNSISLKEFIERATGGNFKKKGDNYIGCCPLHNGDNKGAFVISEKEHIYTCFTRCGTGNIITVAKRYYNIDNFSEVVFKLANDYNLSIPKEYIKEV